MVGDAGSLPWSGNVGASTGGGGGRAQNCGAATLLSNLVVTMLGVGVVLAVIALAGSVPLSQDVSFIGEATSDLALQLLKSSKYQNQVFSPLGYNTLLAIFAEGAKGETRKELTNVLHLPDSQENIRLGYQTVLKRLSDKYKLNHPEMKNWFYIYRNFSVDEDIQNIIRTYYLTEVKLVDRPQDVDFKADSKVKVPTGLQGKPTDHLINVDEDVASIIDSSVSSPHKSDGEEATSEMKPAMFDEKLPGSTSEEKQTDMKEDKPEDLPYGSANNNEKVLPEKEMTKTEDTDKEKVVMNEENEKDENANDKPELVKEEVKEKHEIPEVNNVVDDVKKSAEEETMVAMQRNIDSENEINSDIEGTIKVKGQGGTARILAFNGLFFKGQWTFPFVKKDADESRPFYTTAGKAIVPTLHAEGLFRTADLPEVDARAIELKYDEDRYSMLLVVPNTVEGLTKIDFKDLPLQKISDRLLEKPIGLCMPCFDAMTISKPSLYGMKLGLEKVLSPDHADLSGFSKEPGLYLDELVQVVTVEVNSNSTETVLLTASLASSRSDTEKFQVNRPFYFFIRDTIDDIVVVNGMIVDPSVRGDLNKFS